MKEAKQAIKDYLSVEKWRINTVYDLDAMKKEFCINKFAELKKADFCLMCSDYFFSLGFATVGSDKGKYFSLKKL